MDLFATIIDWCLDRNFPLKRIPCGSTKHHTPWMSDNIMATIREKNRAKHVVEKTRNTADSLIYRKLKNSLKSMIRSAKLTYIQRLLERSYTFCHMAAQLWSRVNEVIGRQSISKLVTISGKQRWLQEVSEVSRNRSRLD